MINSILFTETELEHAESPSCVCGNIVVFTARSPAKETVNEDSCAIFQIDTNSCVLAVADGMGGLPQGSTASRLVMQSLKDTLNNLKETNSVRDAILNSVEVANQKILALSTGAGSTAAIVEIANNIVRPYHIGDSKILVVGQRGKIKLETLSHSPTEYAVEAGFLEPNEAIDHEDRRYVSNMIGAQDMRIELGSPLTLSKYDTVLLASDGLVDNLQLYEIVEIIRKGNLKKCINKLIELCNERMNSDDNSQNPSAPDDLTILLYRMK